jgi:hypothetical protein
LARKLLLENIGINLLNKLRNIIADPEFVARHRSEVTAFIRTRLLPFQTLIVFLLNLNKGAAQDELDNFFKTRDSLDVASRLVTAGALTKARKKLNYQAFTELNDHLTAFFYDHFPRLLWKGYRLLATDGSTVKVPKVTDVAQHFGWWNCAKGEPCPIARVSGLYDVLNRIYLDALIAPKATGERQLAAQHLKKAGSGDILLLDRGYPAYWLFARILAQGLDFCARISATKWQIVKEFAATGLNEQIVTLRPGRRERQSCPPIQVRLVRIDLGTDEPEFLITSLTDTTTITYDDFKELYHYRWRIEEAYKLLKSRMELENFSGKSFASVYQDFHAAILTANLTAALAAETKAVIADNTAGRKYCYQLNYAQALSKMKNTIILLFTRVDIRGIIESLLEILAKTIAPIRPDRLFPRKKKVKLQKFYPGYKRLA